MDRFEISKWEVAPVNISCHRSIVIRCSRDLATQGWHPVRRSGNGDFSSPVQLMWVGRLRLLYSVTTRDVLAKARFAPALTPFQTYPYAKL